MQQQLETQICYVMEYRDQKLHEYVKPVVLLKASARQDQKSYYKLPLFQFLILLPRLKLSFVRHQFLVQHILLLNQNRIDPALEELSGQLCH